MALEKIRVSVGMNPPILLIDYSHQLTLNGTALVRVEAPSSMKSHAPIDLVTLINISQQSTSLPADASPTPTDGAPSSSRMDLLKTAMKFVIRQLAVDDRLAIVAFNDQVVKEHTTGILEISGGGRVAVERKVDGLVAKGGDGTAFKPSLEYAVKLLDDRADKKRVGFIVLISDCADTKFKWGDESIALTDPVRGLLHKYPVHAFGLGKSHDPAALHYIAKTSYGTYSSIADDHDGKNSNKIMEAFAVTVAGFKTVVAVDVCVNIWSSSLQVTRIDSGGYTRRGGSGGVLVGALYAGEAKDLVAHFSFRTGSWARGYHAALSGVTASATYRDAPGRQAASTDTCSAPLAVHVADSASPPTNPCTPHPAVLRQVVRLKVLDLVAGLLREFQALKEEAGTAAVHGAREEGDDRVLQAVAASWLRRKWREFKQSDESWRDAPRSFLDLGGVDGDVHAMVGALNQGLGVGCVYSWLSSCQMQRAASATGLPMPAAAETGLRFRTPAMDAMVREAHRQAAKEASVQDAGASVVVGKRAAELLDEINRRFELWCRLDHDLPSPRQQEEDGDDDKSRSLSAAVRGDISRARQYDIYMASDHAIKQWRSFLTSVEKTRSQDPEDK
ncbi:hypothetical protein BS78_05G048100 [Paspalum vaginatum]|nr:hypothetical protein BS78_05G048100 [Paspalum vaginatum]